MQTVPSVSKSQELWSDSSSEVDWILAQIKDLVQENRYVSWRTELKGMVLKWAVDLLNCLFLVSCSWSCRKQLVNLLNIFEDWVVVELC